MKKLFLLLSAVIVSTNLIACGTASKNNDETTDVSGVQENNEQNEESVKSSESSENMDLPYWILKQEFETPKTSFEGTLFNKDAVLPMDLSVIDAYAAPYSWFSNGGAKKFANTIEEIFSSEFLVNYTNDPRYGYGGSAHILTQETEEERIGSRDEGYCGIGDIYIYNFDESKEGLPISTCYENGWWAIIQGEYADHSAILQIEGGGEIQMADQIMEKFGTPTYIGDININETYGSLEEWFAAMKKDDIESYSFFYEYEDFTLQIRFMEKSFGSEPSLEITYAAYYPTPYWEIQKAVVDYGLIPIK